MNKSAPVGHPDRGERSADNKLYGPMLIGLLAIVGFPQPAPASDVHCPPHLGAEEVDGDLLIAAPCRLQGTRIKGDVRIFAGGSLHAERAVIHGNVRARRADFVTLLRTTVDGNVDLEAMVGDRSTIALSDIDGNVRLRDNRSALDFEDNLVNGNVSIRGTRGSVWIAGNFIDGNLDCRGNNPSPSGRDNRVAGSSQGQCSQLHSVRSDAPDQGSDGDDEPSPTPNEPAPVEPPPAPVEPPEEEQPPQSPPEQDSSPAPPPDASAGSDDAGVSGSGAPLTLDPQPSGGGGAMSALHLLLLLSLLGAFRVGRRAPAGPNARPSVVDGACTRC